MQTFVPYGRDFFQTAYALDRQRLGKQRVEGLQILNAITGRSKGWLHHPAVKMWQGYPESLALYTLNICEVWTDEYGYKDTVYDKVKSMFPANTWHGFKHPEWLDDKRVTLSHRSNLVRKNHYHYGLLWPGIRSDMPYFWPV